MTVALTVSAWALAAGALLAWLLMLMGKDSAWRRVLIGCLVAETVLIGVRWYLTGHPPIFGTHENTLAASWFIGIAVLLLARREGDARILRLLLPWMPVHLAYGLLFFAVTPYPLTISERSVVVDLHVLLAWTAYTVILSGAMFALDTVLRGQAESGGDEVFVSLTLGFAAFTAMLAVGSFYSYQIFGSWFTWEITETICAAAWLGYGLAVHARLLFGWSGRRLAWFALALLPLLLLAFWVWSLYPGTYHHFDIIPIRAT